MADGKLRQPAFAAQGPEFVIWPEGIGRVERAEMHLPLLSAFGKDR